MFSHISLVQQGFVFIYTPVAQLTTSVNANLEPSFLELLYISLTFGWLKALTPLIGRSYEAGSSPILFRDEKISGPKIEIMLMAIQSMELKRALHPENGQTRKIIKYLKNVLIVLFFTANFDVPQILYIYSIMAIHFSTGSLFHINSTQ